MVIKGPPQTKITIPTPYGEEPQASPIPINASNSRELKGGEIGGIVGGSVIAFVIIISAAIFTYKRLGGRGNFELPGMGMYGAGAFHKKKRNTGGSGGGIGSEAGGVVTSGTYDPHNPNPVIQRQNMVQEDGLMFGRSGSGSSADGRGEGYRGATTAQVNPRLNSFEKGSSGGYWTSSGESEGNKSLTSRVTVMPIPPGGVTPPGQQMQQPGDEIYPVNRTSGQHSTPSQNTSPQQAYAQPYAPPPPPTRPYSSELEATDTGLHHQHHQQQRWPLQGNRGEVNAPTQLPADNDSDGEVALPPRNPLRVHTGLNF